MIISKDLFLLGDQDYLRLPKDEKRAMGHKSAKRWVFGLAGMGQGRTGLARRRNQMRTKHWLPPLFPLCSRGLTLGSGDPREPLSRRSAQVTHLRGVPRGRAGSPPRLLTPGTNMAVGPLNCAGSFPCPSLCMRTQTPGVGAAGVSRAPHTH
jgi:hypothetical protein